MVNGKHDNSSILLALMINQINLFPMGKRKKYMIYKIEKTFSNKTNFFHV